MKTNNYFRKIWILAALCVLPAWIGLKAQEVTISGTVYDNLSKTGLPSATVVCPTDGFKGLLTGEDGSYSITVKATDTIKLRVTYIGYDTAWVNISPKAGKTTYTQDILLDEEGVLGEEVVITAGRHEQKLSDVPISMEVVKQKSIDLQATSNIEDVLQQSPGVDILDGQPNIRGSSGFAYGVGSRVMVMLDGLPLLSGDAGFAQFDMIPVDNIAQVEIMKGAASVLYGSSAMGGVINVITADADVKPRTSVRLRTSIYDTPANPALDWDGKSSAWIANLNAFHSRRIKNNDLTVLVDLVNNTGYRNVSSRKQVRGMVMTKFRPKKVPGLIWGVNASAKIDSSNAILYWDSYEPVYDTTITGGDTTIDKSGGALSGLGTRRQQFLQRYNVDPFIKYATPKGDIHTYRGRWLMNVNGNNTGQSASAMVFFNDYQYSTRVWKDRINWVTGATVMYNQINGGDLYGNEGLGLDDTFTSINPAIYTQLDAKFLDDRLSITIGGRYDFILQDDTVMTISPTDTMVETTKKVFQSPIGRIGLNYNTFPGNNIRASFGQGFRAPSIAERFTSTVGGALVIRPAPDLLAERGYSAEVAMRQGFKFGTKDFGVLGFVDLAGFWMRFNNMIEFGAVDRDGLDPIFSARNISNAQIIGGELTALVDAKLNDWSLSLSGGITFTEPMNLNPTPDSLQVDISYDAPDSVVAQNVLGFVTGILQDNPRFLKYRNRTMVRGTFSVGYKDVSLTANYQFKSRMRTYDEFLDIAIIGLDKAVKERDLTTYHMLDLILGYNIKDKVNISLLAENVMNWEYIIVPGLLAEQRKYTVQLKFLF